MFCHLFKDKALFNLCFIMAVVLLVISCQSTYQTSQTKATKTVLAVGKHEPITEQLIVMVEHNPEIKGMLLRSIDMAKKRNPDKITNPAQTLEEYYTFVDWAAKAMPWTILRNTPYSSLYE